MLITVAVVFWFLQKTRTGKAMRAYSDNEDLALLSGISPERVVTITWILAATLATIAGTLYGLDKSFRPFTYFQLLLPIFAAAIVGGIGQPFGAIVGRLPHRLLRGDGDLRLQGLPRLPAARVAGSPSGLVQMLGTDYKFAVSFVILVVVLLFRPTGIFQGPRDMTGTTAHRRPLRSPWRR